MPSSVQSQMECFRSSYCPLSHDRERSVDRRVPITTKTTLSPNNTNTYTKQAFSMPSSVQSQMECFRSRYCYLSHNRERSVERRLPITIKTTLGSNNTNTYVNQAMSKPSFVQFQMECFRSRHCSLSCRGEAELREVSRQTTPNHNQDTIQSQQ